MSIEYSILGLLSWKPSSGYDIKKMFKDSAVMYWSGNNNQIYNTLSKLLDSNLVSTRVEKQESLPDKKVYSITEKGREELKKWTALSPAQPPEFRKPFLLKLAWGDQLNDQELHRLLDDYESEIIKQIDLQNERMKSKTYFPH
jgi:DNA-binding PadR family transcriptional regulator